MTQRELLLLRYDRGATLAREIMGDKAAKDKQSARAMRVWIAPRHSFKGFAGERAWENHRGKSPSTSRYLELADIALGVKKPAPHRRKTQAVTHDMGSKTEPYVR